LGTPYDLYENPNEIFVANFLGETNFLQGFVLKLKENEEMETRIRLGGPKFTLYNKGERFRLDDNVVIAFRYEDVYLFPQNYNFERSPHDWSKMQFFDATLEYSRFIGATKRFYFKLENGDTFTAVKSGTFRENFKVGEKLNIAIHKDDFHVFKAPKNLVYELSLT
ncbi:MAG: hypothetical protein P8Y97_18260, partial [Candidatus Lokiarchaeota archaeon]